MGVNTWRGLSRRSATVALLVAALVVCSGVVPVVSTQTTRGVDGPDSTPRSDQWDALASRVTAYWLRREARDLGGAYAFYCGPYQARVPRGEFMQLTRLVRFDIHDTRVIDIVGTAERAEVTVAYRFRAPIVSADPLEGQATAWWTRDSDGRWCREDEPLVLPFPPMDTATPVPPSER